MRLSKLWTRKCKDYQTCRYAGDGFQFHTHHLTWFGHMYFWLYGKTH